MVSSHQQRKIHRAEHSDPINVTIDVFGTPKVIPFKEWKKMEEYFPKELKEEVVDALTEENPSS